MLFVRCIVKYGRVIFIHCISDRLASLIVLPVTLALSTERCIFYFLVLTTGLHRVRRAVDDHGHEEDDHAEEDTVQVSGVQ